MNNFPKNNFMNFNLHKNKYEMCDIKKSQNIFNENENFNCNEFGEFSNNNNNNINKVKIENVNVSEKEKMKLRFNSKISKEYKNYQNQLRKME